MTISHFNIPIEDVVIATETARSPVRPDGLEHNGIERSSQ
jgi:hypothetical protein